MFDLVLKSDEAIPQGYVNVIANLNPFSDDHRASARLPAGLTIQDYIKTFSKHVDDAPRHIAAFVDGDYIPPMWWDRVRPKAGASLVLKAVPGISAVIAAVAPIIGSTLAPTVASFIGVTSALGTQLIATAITFGVLAVGQALFAPPEPERPTGPTPTFSITGARNRAAPYEAVPVVLGTHRFVPPYGGLPYTEAAGSDQFLRFVVVWGYGPVDVQDVKIGNTPIGQFEDVQVENDFDGTASELGLYPRDVDQQNLSIALNTVFQTRRTAIEIDEFSVTVTFQNGLIRIDDDGDERSFRQDVFVEYRKVGDSSWTLLEKREFEERTRRLFRANFRASGLDRGQYDVRVRTGVNPEEGDPQRFRAVTWTALRGFDNSEDPVELAGVAKSAYRIRANDQLNGVVDQLNAIVSTKIPTWNGSSWTGENISSNPAAIYRYLLTGTPNARAVASSRVDDDFLGEWYEYCEAQGYTYNEPIQTRRALRDLLQNVAAAGFASPAYIDDKWTVIIDRERSTIVQHFTPRNTRNFQGAILYPETPDALRVRFNNERKGYEEDERVVYDDGKNAGNSSLFQVITLPGQTDPDNVYRLGRHFLASTRLRPEIFTFEVDIEHLIATRGDLCRLTHDAAIIGQASGRLTATTSDTITLDEPVDVIAGTAYTIRVRDDEGATQKLTFTATATETRTTLDVGSGNGNLVAAGDLFMFGVSDNESIPVLVSGIEYLDALAASVTCVPYVEDVYNAAQSIPPYESNLSDPRAASFVGPPAPFIDRVVTDEAALFKTRQGDLEPRILIYFTPASPENVGQAFVTPTQFIQARYRPTGSDEPFTYAPLRDAATEFIPLTEVEQGQSYDIDIRAVDGTGGVSRVTRLSNVLVEGALNRPPPVDSFSVNTLGNQAQLEWTYRDPPIDVVGFEIRVHPDADVTDWNRMITISDRVPVDARTFTIPGTTGSAAIKPIDILGKRSETALYINSSLQTDIGDFVLVKKYDLPDVLWNPNLNSELDFVTYSDTFLNNQDLSSQSLILDGDGDPVYTVPDPGDLQLGGAQVMADWPTLADVVVLTIGVIPEDADDPDGGFASSGYIEFGDLDLGGFVVRDARVRVLTDLSVRALNSFMYQWTSLSSVEALNGGANVDGARVYLQVATTEDTGGSPTFGDFRRVTVGDYSAAQMRFRLVLETDDAYVSPVVEDIRVTVEAPTQIRTGQDLVALSGSRNVTFSPEFVELQSVNVAAQDLETGDYYRITNKTRTGFTIEFYDSTDSLVQRTFDYQAIGYGRVN